MRFGGVVAVVLTSLLVTCAEVGAEVPMLRIFGVALPGAGMREGCMGSAAVPLPMMGRMTRIRS